MKTIAITGASGAMGKETLKAIMSSPLKFRAKILLLKSDKSFGFKIKHKYKDRIEVVYGDVRSPEDCFRLVKNCDYVLHLAALIPPKSDYDQEKTISINYGGTKNVVDAIKSLPSCPKLIHISTVAIYGHRNHIHPWGRVGDPLMPSIFDVYATSKMKAERYVLESGIKNFAVLRQTGILYDGLLLNNISDGLMFHTPWNVPIEWVTDVDSGNLMVKIIERDIQNTINDFWNKVYNIGGGKGFRETGFDVFEGGFKIIGGKVETFFNPNWNAERNFHCFWFSDSDVLEKTFHFQSGSSREFWNNYEKNHPLYSVAKILPPSLIRKLVIEPLLKNKNAPQYWISKGDRAKILAISENVNANKKYTWENYPLLKKGKIPNDCFDYEKVICSSDYKPLSHGYDESKPDCELDLDDMKMVAKFRGGECLSESMIKGDLYTPLKWRCHLGHVFFATPYTILKAGHWCDECAPLTTWNYDLTAPYIPFYKQVWYDSHKENECNVYIIKNNKTYVMEGARYER